MSNVLERHQIGDATLYRGDALHLLGRLDTMWPRVD